MLKIKPGIVEAVAAAQSGPDLFEFLQSAVKLEHSTIPPYLTALYSIVPGTNAAVAQIIRSIVVQEMLHMTIAANVANAVRCPIIINRPGFVPTYPGPLPMMVDDDLQVGLEKLSADLVQHTFMRIEEPETPRHFPTVERAAAPQPFRTIGAFYDALMAKILDQPAPPDDLLEGIVVRRLPTRLERILRRSLTLVLDHGQPVNRALHIGDGK